ncbi:MAG: TIGR03808 family TAT-translocated repetitive protein, partial [Pseudomonadota bacterium]
MDRRQFLTFFGTVGATVALARPALTQSRLDALPLGGSVSAVDYNVIPGAPRDQSAAFQAMLDRAAARGAAVFLPAGNYVIADVSLPDGIVLTGVPGRSVLVLGAGRSILRAQGVQSIHLSNLLLDGGTARNKIDALLVARGVSDLQLTGCTVRRSPSDTIRLERCGGGIAACTLTNVRRFGLFSIDGVDLEIVDNRVRDCADGGIIVHRSSPGADGTRITGNRITRVGAVSGGTGQWGNGINVYRT